jgi:hypothetical protein
MYLCVGMIIYKFVYISVSIYMMLRLLLSTHPCTYVLIDLNAQTVPA